MDEDVVEARNAMACQERTQPFELFDDDIGRVARDELEDRAMFGQCRAKRVEFGVVGMAGRDRASVAILVVE